MSFGAKRVTRPAPITVCVRHHPRGRWEVVTPDRMGPILCETLEDARKIAYLALAHAQDCELIVRDAYNRIIEHESITGRRSRPIVSPSRAFRQRSNPGGR